MSDAASFAQRARRQQQIMRVVNVPMRQILALPFPTPMGGRLMLVNLLGRKSGRLYRQPLSYTREDEHTLLTPGGGRWTRNLRPDKPVIIRLRGRDLQARSEFITDRDQLQPVLQRMVELNPSMTRFMPFMGEDGHIIPERLDAALAHGFGIVRWHIEDSS